MISELTAKMDGTILGGRVVSLRHIHRLLPHVQHLTFSVVTDNASLRPGSVTTQEIALMGAMRRTVVSRVGGTNKPCKYFCSVAVVQWFWLVVPIMEIL